jgi:hypothetical protein
VIAPLGSSAVSTDHTVTYFTVADERFFVGLACLVNSLRLTGNEGEIVALDGGLSRPQADRLAGHVRLVPRDEEALTHPVLLKAYPHLLEPQGTIVVIDSDMIVTRSLDPILDQVALGKVCLFADIEDQRDRRFAEWEEVFGLGRPPRRQHYLNSGFIALSTEHHPDLLSRFWEVCNRIPVEGLVQSGADYEQPFWGGDQDAINALLMSEVDADDVLELPELEGPSPTWLDRVRIEDARSLRCTIDGYSPYLLHYWGTPKPWQPRSWLRVERDAYVELMPRVLFAADCPVRVDPHEVPPWMRQGRGAAAARSALGAINRTGRRGLELLPDRWRTGLARAARR